MTKNSSYWGGQKMDRKLVFLICLMAFVFFCILFGAGKLNPGYKDWLFGEGDAAIQYIGVQAYRQSPWLFPFGNLNTLHYPDTSSIIFTDSIPLLAIVYKLLSPLFKDSYQYIGIWVLICYIITGLLSGKILSRFIRNKISLLIGVAIVLLNPVLAFRYFAHASLMGQWTILLSAIPLVFYDQWPSDSRKMLMYSGILGFLMPSVHMYFFLESGLVLFAYCLYDALKRRKFIAEVINLALYCLCGALSIFLLGGFSGTRKFWGGAGGFGEYSFNLNGLVNAQGYSQFYNGLAFNEMQREGFSYLGIGVISLLILCLVLVISIRENRKWLKEKKELIITFVVFTIISVLISASPKVTLGDKVLIEIPFPRIIERIWGIFRSTGRLIWPLYYFLFFAGIILIERLFRDKRIVPLILSACLLIQVIDLYPLLSKKNVADNIVYHSGLDEDKWLELIDKTNTKHLVLMGIGAAEGRAEDELGLFAVKHGLTLNMFRMAHGELTYLEAAEKSIRYKEKGYLYIFMNQKESSKYPELSCFEMNDYWLGIPVEDN